MLRNHPRDYGKQRVYATWTETWLAKPMTARVSRYRRITIDCPGFDTDLRQQKDIKMKTRENSTPVVAPVSNQPVSNQIDSKLKKPFKKKYYATWDEKFMDEVVALTPGRRRSRTFTAKIGALNQSRNYVGTRALVVNKQHQRKPDASPLVYQRKPNASAAVSQSAVPTGQRVHQQQLPKQQQPLFRSSTYAQRKIDALRLTQIPFDPLLHRESMAHRLYLTLYHSLRHLHSNLKSTPTLIVGDHGTGKTETIRRMSQAFCTSLGPQVLSYIYLNGAHTHHQTAPFFSLAKQLYQQMSQHHLASLPAQWKKSLRFLSRRSNKNADEQLYAALDNYHFQHYVLVVLDEIERFSSEPLHKMLEWLNKNNKSKRRFVVFAISNDLQFSSREWHAATASRLGTATQVFPAYTLEELHDIVALDAQLTQAWAPDALRLLITKKYNEGEGNPRDLLTVLRGVAQPQAQPSQLKTQQEKEDAQKQREQPEQLVQHSTESVFAITSTTNSQASHSAVHPAVAWIFTQTETGLFVAVFWKAWYRLYEQSQRGEWQSPNTNVLQDGFAVRREDLLVHFERFFNPPPSHVLSNQRTHKLPGWFSSSSQVLDALLYDMQTMGFVERVSLLVFSTRVPLAQLSAL